MEAHLTLAFAVRSSPGAYALLLGAGVSMGSGVQSAWGVQQELISRLATVEGEHPEDVFAWYQKRYDKASSYDDLLTALTHTPEERQALLRDFFEPTEEEREAGLKIPTTAHRAVARLVSAGLVRIILTINFDRLLETALRDEGVEPTIVASPSDITGVAPLHTLRCLVIHVHGDYLNPMSMLNTAKELGDYPPELDKLLDRVFDEYGLIIAGWSARWDTALRNALSRCPSRRFGTYWIDPSPLGEYARGLLAQRQATFVQATADGFFGRLADACDALKDTDRQHPKTIEVAVATAKRALAGHRTAIPLHDMLREELDRIRALGPLSSTNFNASDVQGEHTRRLTKIESGCEVALALIATAAYWGDENTNNWWFGDIERFGLVPQGGGLSALIALVQAPATMITYAAGVAAIASSHWELVGRLLTEPVTSDQYTGQKRLVAHLLDPARTLTVANASQHLYEYMRPIFAQHLTLGDAAYADAWERFEYLRLVTQEDQRVQGIPGRSSQMPFLRVDGQLDGYQPRPSRWLRNEIERLGAEHPMLKAGIAGGSDSRLVAAADSYDTEFGNLAGQYVWARMMDRPGPLPESGWYPTLHK